MRHHQERAIVTRSIRLSALFAALTIAGGAEARRQAPQEPPYSPAQLQQGRLPPIPVDAVGGGEVLVELDVSEGGAVTRATPLRTTPPFTELVVGAVRSWQFAPARDLAQVRGRSSRIPVSSSVMVVAVYRAPVLVGPTLGDPPKEVAPPSSAVASPALMSAPPFPPNAFGGGSVLLEVRVDAAGAIEKVTVLQSLPPFDEAAVKTVRDWLFRPAQRNGVRVPALVYVVFGFRVPV